jgi:signal transduction histidine kinase
VTGLGVAVAGWTAFALAATLAARLWHSAAIRGHAVARACHEVRGPLAAVRLGVESSLSGAAATRLRAIEVELARATAALDQLQAGDRGVLGGSGLERIDVMSWLSDSVEAWGPVALACGTEMRLSWIGPSASVWGRQARLAQVTGNLMANAIEHGGGAVEVRGRARGSSVEIEIEDGGPGLPVAVRDWLEGAARRGRVRRHGPAARRGHGLAIARAVAEAHGGELRAAESQRGARLVLRLPLARE